MKCAYVYYRIDPAQAPRAADRIAALLGMMAAHCSQPPRRLVRCGDPSTWMETYEGVGDFIAFEAALHAATRTLDWAAFTLGERHLECFVPADPLGPTGRDGLRPPSSGA